MTPVEKLIDSNVTPNEKPKNIVEGKLWATHSGTVRIADFDFKCHVLSNGTRIFDKDDIERFFGVNK